MLKEAISDDNKNVSSIRIMSFIALIVACYVTYCAVRDFDKITVNVLYLLAFWLVAAFAPKVIQKVVEKWADFKIGGVQNVGSGTQDDDNK